MTDASLFVELRNEYHVLTCEFADRRWGVARLTEEVAKLREAKAVKDTARAAEEARKAVEKAERDARIAARGSVEEFTTKRDLEDSERKLSWLLRRAMGEIEHEAKKLKDFAKSMSENPLYALSWSKDVFDASAKAAVAKDLVGAFEAGVTFEEWQEEARLNAMRMARSPAMSTSPTSNLVDTYLCAAWADAASESLI
jgi:hypothetical protein